VRTVARCRVSGDLVLRELNAYWPDAAGTTSSDEPLTSPWSRRRILLSCWTLPVHLLLRRVADWLRVIPGRWPSEYVALVRVYLDVLHPFRCASSLHEALTDLGLGLARRGELEIAISCLDSSWHVHPDPRLASYGLRPELVAALVQVEGAQEACSDYHAVASRFSPHRPFSDGAAAEEGAP